MKFLPLVFALAAAQLECPALECFDNARPDDLCFEHSGTSPVSKVNFYPCQYPDQICDLSPATRDFAWVNSTQQQSNAVETDPELSPLFGKRITAYCVPRDRFKQEVLPGRYCTQEVQCLSG